MGSQIIENEKMNTSGITPSGLEPTVTVRPMIQWEFVRTIVESRLASSSLSSGVIERESRRSREW